MVGTEGRERDDAAHGRDLDDVARPLLTEGREDRLRDMENAEQVRLELIAQLLLGDLLDRSEEPVARVVDDDVDPPERLVRGLHRSEHLVAVGDVELDREDGVAVLLDQVTQSVCVAGGRCGLIATLEGGEGELAAKAFRRAGDEPNFAHDKPPVGMDGHPQAGWLSRIFLSSLCRWAAVAARSSAVSGCVSTRVDGRGYLLSCLSLARWAARVLVRTLRSLAACWSMACGPLPVSSRTDGS